MTEKRFTVDENHQGVYAYIKDNDEYVGKRCGKKNVYYVCDLLNEQDQEIKELKRMLQLVSEAETVRDENSVKEIVRDNLFGLDTVAGESVNAYNDYLILDKFFKEYYNEEYWDNDKFD